MLPMHFTYAECLCQAAGSHLYSSSCCPASEILHWAKAFCVLGIVHMVFSFQVLYDLGMAWFEDSISCKVPAITCACALPSLIFVAAAPAAAVAAEPCEVDEASTTSAVGSAYAAAGAAAADSKHRCSTSPSAEHLAMQTLL